jgi:hypothetical protein
MAHHEVDEAGIEITVRVSSERLLDSMVAACWCWKRKREWARWLITDAVGCMGVYCHHLRPGVDGRQCWESVEMMRISIWMDEGPRRGLEESRLTAGGYCWAV